MKNINTCAVVVGISLKEFLINLQEVQKISDLIELRADMIKDIDFKGLKIIKEKTYKKAILTWKRSDLIKDIMLLGFDLVDIDWKIAKKTKLKKNKNTKMIISYIILKKHRTCVN